MDQDQRPDAASLACRVVAAYVGKNSISPDGVLRMLKDLMNASSDLAAEVHPDDRAGQLLAPAVSIEDSITDDYIVCLEDGLRFKSLRRHLSQKYQMTPDEYRARWGLPKSYPMMAPAYARARSEVAKLREQRKRQKAGAGSPRLKPKSRMS